MAAVCPVCGKDDVIQKVSAVVSSGQLRGSLPGIGFGFTSSEKAHALVGILSSVSAQISTNLATSLAKGDQPRPKWNENTIWGVVFLALAGFFPLMIIGLYFPVALFGLFSPDKLDQQWARWFFIAFTLLTAGYLLVVIVTTAFMVVLDKEVSDKYKHQGTIWEKASLKWDRLYYCFRDDIVFDQKTGSHFAPQLTQEYIYRN